MALQAPSLPLQLWDLLSCSLTGPDHLRALSLPLSVRLPGVAAWPAHSPPGITPALWGPRAPPAGGRGGTHTSFSLSLPGRPHLFPAPEAHPAGAHVWGALSMLG